MSDQPQPNPYASPKAVADDLPRTVDDETLRLLAQPIRWYWPALGVPWLLFGILSTIIGMAILGRGGNSDSETLAAAALFFGFNSFTLIVGLMICFRHVWAVYISLVVTYVALGMSVVLLRADSLIPAAILGAAILIAHRIISYSNQMKAFVAKRPPLHTAVEPPT